MKAPEDLPHNQYAKARKEPLLDFLEKLSLGDIDLARDTDTGNRRDLQLGLLGTVPNKGYGL
jgi:hypothetical protein